MGGQICRSSAEKARWSGKFAGAVQERCDGLANLPEPCIKGALVGQICRSRAKKVRWAGKFAGAVQKRCDGRASLPEPVHKRFAGWANLPSRRPGRGLWWDRGGGAEACAGVNARGCARMRAHARVRAHARPGRRGALAAGASPGKKVSHPC